jgi:hypothetical protein
MIAAAWRLSVGNVALGLEEQRPRNAHGTR